MKTCFIYWGPHDIHKTWAESLDAEFRSFVPGNSGIFKKNGILLHISAFLKGFFLPKADLYLLESPMMVSSLLPRILLGGKPNIVAINSDPFFLSIRNFKGTVKRYFDYTITHIKALISTSEMMGNLALAYQHIPRNIKNFTVPIFIDLRRYSKISPNTSESNFCFIGPYLNKQKGVDILISMFEKLKPDGKLYLVGTASSEIQRILHSTVNVEVTGFVKNPEHYLSGCKYYLNLARFEPAGANILEAMAAGFVPIVSRNCGVSDAVKKLSPALVVDPEKDDLTLKFNKLKRMLSDKNLSKKARAVARTYSREASLTAFRRSISAILGID